MPDSFPKDWQLLPLEQCMAAIIDYRGKSPVKTTTGIPLITAKVVKGGRIDEPDEFIAETDYDEWMRRGLPQPGDVVMTTEAPLGEIAQLDDRKVALAQRLITLRGRPRFLENTYLKFLMQSAFVQDQLKARATGTTVLGIRQSELRKVSLVVPPYDEQLAIAKVLGPLDDKIEINSRVNQTLQATARAIFKSWFLDFDPVRAKAAGQSLPGLHSSIAALFPNRFQDSELGQIPSGWSVAKVADEVHLTKGVSYRSQELADSRTALVTLKSFKRGGGYRPDGLKPYTGEFDPDQVVQPGELVVAHTDVTQAAEVVGKPALVLPDVRFETLVASLDLSIVRPTAGDLSKHFFYLLFEGSDFQAHVYGHTNGTTVLHLSKTGVPTYRFVRPTKAVAQAFTAAVRPIFEKIVANDLESRTLACSRDTLLPKLLSGELRIPT